MALIHAVLNGRLAVSGIYKERLATCTTCLACEAACPSNVPVTKIIQAAKEQVVADSGRGIVSSLIAGMVKRPALFRVAARFAPVALHYSRQGSGDRVKERRLRNAPDKDVRGQAPCGVRNEKKMALKAKGRVAFFPGCAIEYVQHDIGAATIRVLNTIGYDVIVPNDLKCCGRPLLSLGDRQAAEELAAHNTALFEALEVEAIVTSCASCGLTFKKDYPQLLQAGTKAPVVLDIHEFLAGRLAGIKLNPVSKSVTIHDPCHLGRGQGLSRTVRDLLQTIPGLTLAEMKDPDRCCGFGGVMRITHRELSDGIAVDKVNNIIATRAAVVATGCPGCCMQITDALKRHGSEIGVVHPVQLLEEALSIEE
jgi:glycolate oxidase iron-sulfur subunit